MSRNHEAANKELKLAKPGQDGASQLNSSVRQQRASQSRTAGVKGIVTTLPLSAVLLRNATPSVLHQRHTGRVLRSS
jgi:hypothetical protein